MKTLRIILILFFVSLNVSYAQKDAIYINEGSSVKLCGKTIIFDGLWIDNGVRKADITILENFNSKPMTGGYSVRGKIDIDSNCAYFVHSIYKMGILTKGSIKISRSQPELEISVIQGRYIVKEGEKIYYGDDSYVLSKVYSDKGELLAAIKISRDDLDTTVIFKKGSIMWSEGFPFSITSIDLVSKSAEFLKIDNYYYNDTPVPKGEELNKPLKDDK